MTREREYFFGEDRMGRGGFGGRPADKGGPRGPGGFVHKSQIVKQLKENMQSGHKTGLNQKILDYFAPRPPLLHGTELKKKKLPVPFTGLAAFVDKFAGPQDPEEVKDSGKIRLYKNPELALQCRLNTETQQEKALRLLDWKREEVGEESSGSKCGKVAVHTILIVALQPMAYQSETLAVKQVADAARGWDPHKDLKAEGDPFRTIFVAKLSFEVTEKKLRREFEEFGPIRRVRIVLDKAGKSRGYGFIEFEDKKDMKEAYKQGDGKKIEGRRVLVDVERGRTVETWRPRRLAGGLGGEGRLPRAPKKGKGLPLMPPLPLPDLNRRVVDHSRGPSGPPRERSPVRVDRDRERGGGGGDRGRIDPDRSVDRERKRDRDGSPRRGDDLAKRRRDGDGDRSIVDRSGGDRDRRRRD
ncbi:hypothetical protein QJQ45_017989 [Haematococcus lacustris]|nr:hypothetical protein QJQ45_017989 [Haematococcus lacustris]